MPTVHARPWSTQYKDTFARKSKSRHVTIKSTPITYPIPSDGQYLSGGRPCLILPSDLRRNKEHKSAKRRENYTTHPPSPRTRDVPHTRPYTSAPVRRLLSPYLSATGDIEDRPDTVEPGHLFGATESIERGAALTFVPELKSWVSNANTDYERNAAIKVSQTMQRGLTPIQRSRSVSPMRTRPFYGRSQTYGEGGFGYPQELSYSQTWNPYTMPNPENDTYMNGFPRHLEGAMPMSNFTMYPQTARESRPMARHMRRGSLTRGYVHDLSCFQSTQPMVTGHFVIHPDWVSERMTPRRKPKKTQTQIQY